MPGVSDNIRVRSIVGRFLEHTRVFYFENGGKPLVYCSSADWMGRNLHRRVETCFPVLDRRLKRRIYKEGLEPYLADDTQAWLMQSDGGYERAVRSADRPVAAQNLLLSKLAETGTRRTSAKRRRRSRVA